MRNILLFILFFIIINNAQAFEVDKELSIYANVGYRTDDLDWNIASDSTASSTPNILSELTWSNLEIYQLTVGGYLPVLETQTGTLYIHGFTSQGSIFAGENQDSDYDGNNRTQESSRSNNKSDSGEVSDYSLAFHYQIPVINNDSIGYFVTPFAGYYLYQQYLNITDGFQTIPADGAFYGLNSSYDASWQGIFIGMSLATIINNKHKFELSGKYHDVYYYAEADWNLRSDFSHPKSFEHEAYGYGIDLNIKYEFQFDENLAYNISFNNKDFHTDPGVDRTFFSSGSVTETRLNEVNWVSTSIMVGLSYNF